MLSSKNSNKFGLKLAFMWKKTFSPVGSLSAQRYLLHLSELIFFSEKREKAQISQALWWLFPQMGQGQRKTQVFPNNKIHYGPVGNSSVGFKVCFYIHKHCQSMKVNVLFQHGLWLMGMEGRTSRPIFPQKGRNRRAVNSFCFPAILLSFLNCFAQPLMFPGLPYTWRLSSLAIFVFNWSNNYGKAASAYSIHYIWI